MKSTAHPFIGIDVGRSFIVVGIPPITKADKRQTVLTTPTITIEFTDPSWWRTLLDLIDENGVVAAESTGHHALAPIAELIITYRPSARLYEVQGKATQNYRRAFVHATAKTDALDATSLCLIARDLAAGQSPLGTKEYDFMFVSKVQTLRMTFNAFRRAQKDRVRCYNRLKILAHNLNPRFGLKFDTWLSFARSGYITVQDIRDLVASDDFKQVYPDGRSRVPLKGLAADLPVTNADPTILQQIHTHLDEYAAITAREMALKAPCLELIDQEPFAEVTRRWRTVPSISETCICAYHIATSGQAQNFTRDEFTSAFGANPTTKETGNTKKDKASKKGYKPARALIHLHAMRLLNEKTAANPIRTYIQHKYPNDMSHTSKMPNARTKLARILHAVANDPDGYRYR